MKLEDGKFYKMRDGRKMQIYAIHEEQDRPVHGASYENGKWYQSSWNRDGSYGSYAGAFSCDIVDEWREPISGTFWVNVYPTGISAVQDTRADADKAANKERIACVEVHWTEGEGLEKTK